MVKAITGKVYAGNDCTEKHLKRKRSTS